MNDKNLSLEDAFRLSGKYTRKRAFKFWFVTHIMIPVKRRRYLYLCYIYLRWVDDFVDNSGENAGMKKSFVESQLKLIRDFKEGKNVEVKTNEEFMIREYISYAVSINNQKIIDEAESILKSIRLDAERLQSGQVFSLPELRSYIDIQTRPVFNLIFYFLCPEVIISENNPYVGKFLWFVLALRDFAEDINSGFINISCEEIEKYSMDMNNLKNDERRFAWMSDKFPDLIDILDQDASILNSMPVKVKLFWWPAFPALITELLRMHIYNYSQTKKIFLREFKIYRFSFSLSIKAIIKIFFYKGLKIKTPSLSEESILPRH
jgi:hypothetical protein